jgi:hypothetical protein
MNGWIHYPLEETEAPLPRRRIVVDDDDDDDVPPPAPPRVNKNYIDSDTD